MQITNDITQQHIKQAQQAQDVGSNTASHGASFGPAAVVSFSPEALALQEQERIHENEELQGMAELFGLSPEEEKRADKLFDELDSIFANGEELTAKQEQRVEEIFSELDELFPVNDELAFTEDQTKRLDTLFGQLDTLYSKDTLTQEQLKHIENIEKEVDEIFMLAEQQTTS